MNPRSSFARLCLACLSVTLLLANPVDAEEVVGPVVGTVESTTAHVLYRPGAAAAKLQLSVFANGELAQQAFATCSAANDFVAQFAITGLTPATKYTYQISNDSGRVLVAADEKHFFTTADPAREGKRVSVSFVSCVDIEPNGIWNEMERLNVDAAFLMGDTPYIDSSDLKIVRERHRKFLQMPDLAALAAHTPTMGSWDDHDFGRNNGNGRNMLNGKADTRRGFVEYRAHSQYGNGKEGVYHKVDLGMIEVFLLDPRYFSQVEPSPVDRSQPTCFGTDQWKWLLKGLSESKAPFKVLAMGAIWQDKQNGETDDMFTYWYERDALLDFIEQENIGGVVLLGGDIHVARHLVHRQRVGYDLHDFVISPGHARVITKLNVYHPSLEWSLVEGWQFLTLTADGTGDATKLIAEYRQPNGVVNRKVEIPLSEMAVAPTAKATPALRAHWSFDGDLANKSVLGDRIDARSVNGAEIVEGGIVGEGGVSGSAIQLNASKQQYLVVPRSVLDDNSAAHTVSLWFKPHRLPAHGSAERAFLLESTATGEPSPKAAWNLSLGLITADDPDKVNVQLFTHTVQPAARPEAAPTTLSQGPFDFAVARDKLLDQWSHVAVAFDSKRLTLFLNGESVAKHELPIPGPASQQGGLIIGGHRAGTGRNFHGLIDEVSIWQGVLDPAAIKKLSH